MSAYSVFATFFTVSKTMLVMLVIITNCKNFRHFWLVAASLTCVAKVTCIWVLAKNILLLAMGC